MQQRDGKRGEKRGHAHTADMTMTMMMVVVVVNLEEGDYFSEMACFRLHIQS